MSESSSNKLAAKKRGRTDAVMDKATDKKKHKQEKARTKTDQAGGSTPTSQQLAIDWKSWATEPATIPTINASVHVSQLEARPSKWSLSI